MLVSHRLTPTWPLHTKLYNFAQNISTNISTSGHRTYLKLGELPSLSIVYNITISWLYPLNGFWFYFLLRDSKNTLFCTDLAVIHPYMFVIKWNRNYLSQESLRNIDRKTQISYKLLLKHVSEMEEKLCVPSRIRSGSCTGNKVFLLFQRCASDDACKLFPSFYQCLLSLPA